MYEWKAQNAIFLDNQTEQGRPFKARFLQAGLVKYDFGVCMLKKETIDKFVDTFVNTPVIIGHKDYIDEVDKVGIIQDVWFSDADGWFWCSGILTSPEAIELVNNGYSVSCQYRITEYKNNTSGKLHNGNPYDKEILNGVFEHLAIVKNPRYEEAIIAVNAIVVENADDFITVGEGEDKHPIPVDYLKTDKVYDNFINVHQKAGLIEDAPQKFTGKTVEEICKYLGIEEKKPAIIKTPVDKVIINKDHIVKLVNLNEPSRKEFINYTIRTLEEPNLIIKNGEKNKYIKLFKENKETKPHLQIVKVKGDGSFYVTNFRPSKNQVVKEINEGQVIYDLSNVRNVKTSANSIITDDDKKFNPQGEKMEAQNGWITTDRLDEDGNRIKIWIEGVSAQPKIYKDWTKKTRNEFLDAERSTGKINEPKFEYRSKVSDADKHIIETTFKKLYSEYKMRPVAGIGVMQLADGTLGVCNAMPPHKYSSIKDGKTEKGESKGVSTIALNSQMTRGKYTEADWEEGKKSGFHPNTEGGMLENVLTHEFAHAITANNNDNEFWAKISKIRTEYMKNIEKSDIKNPDYVSKYARENKDEFVAECFTQAKLSKNPSKYAKQVLDVINEHYTGASFKTLSNSLEENREEDQEDWIEAYGLGYPINEEAYEKFKKEQNKKEKAKNSIEQFLQKGEKMKEFIETFKDIFAAGYSAANEAKEEKHEEEAENKCKNENVDKRKLIDEVAGIMKSAGCDDEVIRTAIGKMEKIGYDKSEADDKADNKAKNEEEEKEEKKEVVEEKEEKAENKCKNAEKAKCEEDEKKEEEYEELKEKTEEEAMNKAKNDLLSDVASTQSLYISREERIERGMKY